MCCGRPTPRAAKSVSATSLTTDYQAVFRKQQKQQAYQQQHWQQLQDQQKSHLGTFQQVQKQNQQAQQQAFGRPKSSLIIKQKRIFR